MPNFVKTKQDEKDWEKAKEIFENSYGRKPNEDYEWKIVTKIYQNVKKGQESLKEGKVVDEITKAIKKHINNPIITAMITNYILRLLGGASIKTKVGERKMSYKDKLRKIKESLKERDGMSYEQILYNMTGEREPRIDMIPRDIWARIGDEVEIHGDNQAKRMYKNDDEEFFEESMKEDHFEKGESLKESMKEAKIEPKRRKIIDLWKQGKTPEEIAKEVGKPLKDVKYFLDIKESLSEDHFEKGEFPFEEFEKGYKIEAEEHSDIHPTELAQLVLDHLKEDEYYYSPEMKESLQKFDYVKKKIQTMDGDAIYIGTEVEDENGNWDDSYNVDQGYHVIHKGKKHHIYTTRKKESPAEVYKPKVGDRVRTIHGKGVVKMITNDRIRVDLDNGDSVDAKSVTKESISTESLKEGFYDGDHISVVIKELIANANTDITNYKRMKTKKQIIEWLTDDVSNTRMVIDRLKNSNMKESLLEESMKEGKAKVIKSLGRYKVIKDGETIAVYVAKYEAEDHARELNESLSRLDSLHESVLKEGKKTLDTIKVGDTIYLKKVTSPVKVTAYAVGKPNIQTTKGLFPVSAVDLDRINNKESLSTESVLKEASSDWKRIHDNMWENKKNNSVTIRYYRLTGDNWGVSLYKNSQPVKEIAKTSSERKALIAANVYMRTHSESLSVERLTYDGIGTPNEILSGFEKLSNNMKSHLNTYTLKKSGVEVRISFIKNNIFPNGRYTLKYNGKEYSTERKSDLLYRLKELDKNKESFSEAFKVGDKVHSPVGYVKVTKVKDNSVIVKSDDPAGDFEFEMKNVQKESLSAESLKDYKAKLEKIKAQVKENTKKEQLTDITEQQDKLSDEHKKEYDMLTPNQKEEYQDYLVDMEPGDETHKKIMKIIVEDYEEGGLTTGNTGSLVGQKLSKDNNNN